MMITIQSIEKPPLGRPSRRAPYTGPILSAARSYIFIYGGRPSFFSSLRTPARDEKIVSGSERTHPVPLTIRHMEDAANPRRHPSSRSISGAEWQVLLAALDPDPVLAATDYETLRNGLIAIFRSRGLRNRAEDLADRAIDVSARRLLEKSLTSLS